MIKEKSTLNQIYNTAGGSRTSLLDLAKLLKELLVSYDNNINEIEFVFGPKREGDIPHSFASIEKAKNKLGYMPNYDLKEGLSKSIKWYLKNK